VTLWKDNSKELLVQASRRSALYGRARKAKGCLRDRWKSTGCSKVCSEVERPLCVPSASTACSCRRFWAENALVMSHANKDHNSFSLKYDTTSKLPSKHSQPPIATDNMAWLDYDTRTRLIKKFRTQFASGPSTVVAVLAGVSPHISSPSAECKAASRCPHCFPATNRIHSLLSRT
jgi:hypothetical protein